LFCIDRSGRTQCGKGYSQEPDALRDRKLRPQQLHGNLLQHRAPFDQAAQRLAASDLLQRPITTARARSAFSNPTHAPAASGGALAMTALRYFSQDCCKTVTRRFRRVCRAAMVGSDRFRRSRQCLDTASGRCPASREQRHAFRQGIAQGVRQKKFSILCRRR
jgi:hypothetical protein